MKKVVLLAVSILTSARLYGAQGNVSFGFGVEREGVDLALDYSLPKTSFESYKAFLRYQSSSITSTNQNLMLGVAAGSYGIWGPYSAFILPGLALNIIEKNGVAFGPSLEIGALYALDTSIAIGFSKFDNWIWLGKRRGFWNSSFMINFDYKI